MKHSSKCTRLISGSERLTLAKRWVCLMLVIPVLATNAAAQNTDEAGSLTPEAKQPADEGNAPKPADPGVAVSRFEFSYGLTLPDLPPLDELKSLTIKSTREGNVFRVPAESGAEDLTLGNLPEGSHFDGGTLLGITQEVVRWCAAHGLKGVWVAFTDLEPSVSGVVDNRPADTQVAQLLIWVTQTPPAETNAPPPAPSPNTGEAVVAETAPAPKPEETVAPPVTTEEAPGTNSPAVVATPTTDAAGVPPPVVAQEAIPSPAGEATAPAPDEATAVQAAAPVPEVQAPLTAEVPPALEPAAPAEDEAVPAVVASVPPAEAAEVPAQTPAAPVRDEPMPVAETTTPSVTEAVPVPETVVSVPVPVEASSGPATLPDAPSLTQGEVAPVAETTPSPVAEAAPAPETPPAAPTPVDPGVTVNHFAFSYGLPHPDLPPLEQLDHLTVKSSRDGDVFRAPTASGAENLILSGVPAGSRFDGGALRGIAQEVVRWYNTRGLYGVWVAYTDLENSAAGVVDNRSADNQAAHLVIWASQIAEVRTLARGKRIKPQFSIDSPKHRRIISRSPLHPATKDEPGSLFNQDVLNDYLYGLSLHPGRRVEASIASAGQPGRVVLDFLVNESKPWQIFSQVNNYGTEQTGQYRARLGFQHTQLTNHDDILNVDLISTPDFKTYGSFLSYRIPLWRPAKILFRIYGSYGDFVANDTTSVVELRYVGKNWLGGMELTNRTTLWRDWQLLSALGFNFNHYGIQQVINENPLVTGTSNFLVPFLSTTLSRNYSWGSLSGGLRFDHTVGSFANDDPTTGLTALGRRGAEPDWTSARWNLNGTVYLEPLFSRSAKALTLAHEVSLRLKGRVLLRGKRLIPHEQEPLGGALSIRGYPESILSADEFVAATFEYAYHIPRGLKPAEEGTLFRRPFKWRPKRVGENPDWDLVLRAFYDYAYRGVNPAAPLPGQEPTKEEDLPYIDKNFSIAGYGVGVALMVKQNFSLRCDYGVALTKLEDTTRLEGEQVILAKGNKQIYLITSFSW